LACGGAATELWAEGRDEEYLTTDDRFNYYKCDACGVLSIDPVPRDRLNQIYPPNYYSFDDEVTESLAFRVKDWLDQRFYRGFLSKLTQKQINVLDVGGGTGAQLSSLRKADARITHTAIVDLDERAGQAARGRGHDYFCGRFQDYAPNRMFDVILMLNLIEHVDNPGELLYKARSILSEQGIVLIKTPNTDSLDARLFRYKNWGGYHCPRHWVLFNRENLETLVEKSGLKVRHFQYTQGAPFWTTSTMFAMSRHKWISITPSRPVPRHSLYPILNVAFAALDIGRGAISKTSQMQLILGK
jgi:2-polyprenyl-3-methyl-5-hydroxy-6-metoxy-1,4-benzoquinol methylase